MFEDIVRLEARVDSQEGAILDDVEGIIVICTVDQSTENEAMYFNLFSLLLFMGKKVDYTR